MSSTINFCPLCGGKLYEDGKEYLVQVSCAGQRSFDGTNMMLFVDDTTMYELIPGEDVYFNARAGFHNLKFRHKIRTKTIQILLSSNFSIKAYYNSLSSLIETSVAEVDEKNKDAFLDAQITPPVMVSSEGQRGFDIMLGEDDPEYEFSSTSGLKEGVLRLFYERLEFHSAKDFKKEMLQYKDIVSIRKKMGAVDFLCEGNVHKVYSIPKDIYNEVLVFLNNRIDEVNSSSSISD